MLNLTGYTFCFTGQVSKKISRKAAEAAVKACGGAVSSSVTARTTDLIIGEYPSIKDKSDGCYISLKQKRARELIEQGQAIQIHTAEKFLEMLPEEVILGLEGQMTLYSSCKK